MKEGDTIWFVDRVHCNVDFGTVYAIEDQDKKVYVIRRRGGAIVKASMLTVRETKEEAEVALKEWLAVEIMRLSNALTRARQAYLQ